MNPISLRNSICIQYDNRQFIFIKDKKKPIQTNRSYIKLGWEMGLEPTTPGTTIRCSAIELHPPQNSMSRNYFKLARQKGLEPLTLGLEGRCSIQLSYWRSYVHIYTDQNLVAAQGFEPRTSGL